jgi:hypothetical protein
LPQGNSYVATDHVPYRRRVQSGGAGDSGEGGAGLGIGRSLRSLPRFMWVNLYANLSRISTQKPRVTIPAAIRSQAKKRKNGAFQEVLPVRRSHRAAVVCNAASHRNEDDCATEKVNSRLSTQVARRCSSLAMNCYVVETLLNLVQTSVGRNNSRPVAYESFVSS